MLSITESYSAQVVVFLTGGSTMSGLLLVHMYPVRTRHLSTHLFPFTRGLAY